MAFKKVSTQKKFYKYKECTPGQKLVDEGFYVGPSQGKFGVIHDFKQKNGELVTLNSAGHLNWLLEKHVNTGDLVNVYYKEKTKVAKGPLAGKDTHAFELEIDSEGRLSTPMPAPKLSDNLDDIVL